MSVICKDIISSHNQTCHFLHNMHCRLSYPSIFIVYQTLTVTIHNIIVLVGRIDPDKLFCTSQSLYESSNNPTPFCVISGLWIDI